MYPDKFQKVIDMYERLPGVGNKTAQRFAFTLLNLDNETLDAYADILRDLKNLKRCKVCGFLSDDDTCPICKDESRDKNIIMVVGNAQDLIAIEKTNTYKGTYHILNGLLSSSKGIYPEDLSIDNLLKRINDNTQEIIIATPPTMDGEMTALYLDKVLKNKNVLVTRLAHGLPMGASLDYTDELTLIKAMTNRKKIEEE